MAKKQGKVKSITLKEVTEGQQVVTKYGIGKVTSVIFGDLIKVKIDSSPVTDFKYTDLKTLVVEYEESATGYTENRARTFYGKKQIPLKYSQWQKVLDNNEIEKEVTFEEKRVIGSTVGIDEDIVMVAKIIPEKSGNQYSPQQIKELKKMFNDIMNIGLSLRQDQMNGSSDKSGNDALQEYLQEKGWYI